MGTAGEIMKDALEAVKRAAGPLFCSKRTTAGRVAQIWRFLSSWMKSGAVMFLALACAHAEARTGLEKGVEMYFAGDRVGALEAILPLADQGRPEAQFYAGILSLGKDDEIWTGHMEKAADQCLPEAVEFLIHHVIVAEKSERVAGKTGLYRECVRRRANDFADSRYVLALLEAHAPDGVVGEDSNVAALLDDKVDNLTFRELILAGLMKLSYGVYEDFRPYFSEAAAKGDYHSAMKLAGFASEPSEKKFWRKVANWFEGAMEDEAEDQAEASSDAAVTRYVRANYLNSASGFRALYDKCRQMREDIRRYPYIRGCVAQALNADLECASFALKKHRRQYRASGVYQKCFAVGSAGALWGGGTNMSLRALGRVKHIIQKRVSGLNKGRQ